MIGDHLACAYACKRTRLPPRVDRAYALAIKRWQHARAACRCAAKAFDVIGEGQHDASNGRGRSRVADRDLSTSKVACPRTRLTRAGVAESQRVAELVKQYLLQVYDAARALEYGPADA